MKLVEFPEVTTTFAKDQPQYRKLPAYRYQHDDEGRIVFCWKLSWKERFAVLFGGVLWHQVLTYNRPLQPQKLDIDKPHMPPHD
jgi:hypothetical protein